MYMRMHGIAVALYVVSTWSSMRWAWLAIQLSGVVGCKESLVFHVAACRFCGG